MKFKDIEPYIQCNNYSVDISLRSLESTIDDYIEEMGLELNPDFQRGHVWTERQQELYIEHLLREGVSGLDIYFNHTNWQNTSGKGDGWFVCVDGLQRLTACLRFLKNQVEAFGYLYKDFEDKIPMLIRLSFHVNNLKTRKEVLEWYLQMNNGGTIHSQDELDRVAELLAAES
ncbi:DUF262 domain-containing protein [Paenibacillus amylolyticus]|uniref:DUF262 domain-containing protein n=1 Tax=Paenibacillus amylolyticus TaxID=1451 RepID=UPI003D971D6C